MIRIPILLLTKIMQIGCVFYSVLSFLLCQISIIYLECYSASFLSSHIILLPIDTPQETLNFGTRKAPHHVAPCSQETEVPSSEAGRNFRPFLRSLNLHSTIPSSLSLI